MNPELDAGALDRIITLAQPVYKDEFEDEILEYEPVTDVWASVVPELVRPSEGNSSQRMTSSTAVTVTIRFRTDIDARWRITDGSHQYEIRSIQDTMRRSAHLVLNCTEVI